MESTIINPITLLLLLLLLLLILALFVLPRPRRPRRQRGSFYRQRRLLNQDLSDADVCINVKRDLKIDQLRSKRDLPSMAYLTVAPVAVHVSRPFLRAE
jgi:hypothetical protein